MNEIFFLGKKGPAAQVFMRSPPSDSNYWACPNDPEAVKGAA
jgi:hypothetical protein